MKATLAQILVLSVGCVNARALPYGLDHLESGVSGEMMREIEARRVGGENEVGLFIHTDTWIRK